MKNAIFNIRQKWPWAAAPQASIIKETAPVAQGSLFTQLFESTAAAKQDTIESSARVPEQLAPIDHMAPGSRQVGDVSSDPIMHRVPAEQFCTPHDLEVQPYAVGRALAIGSCFLEVLLGSLGDHELASSMDFVLVNGIEDFPSSPPNDIATYEFQVVQIPLRFVMPDDMFTYLSHDDMAGYEGAFSRACNYLKLQLKNKLTWNTQHGILTFVFNFMLPQSNPMGRFFPRYSLANPSFFVQRLNQEIERLLSGYSNAYLVDLDGLAASFGRRYVQDDTFTAFSHNASISQHQTHENRIGFSGCLGDYYETAPGEMFRHAILEELRAMMRTVRQTDTVKLVVLDLDDTLWNGVSGDTADIGPHMLEGWPVGVVEALAYVRKRGVVLAICSKNDEHRIRRIWHSIFHNRLSLEDFAAIRINWLPKTENMSSILRGMNLLPQNVLFVDDNPAEREAMRAAFPGMRVIGDNPFHTRRILLHAAEMQTAIVTAESSRRTEMIQAQFEREAERSQVTPEDFARDQQIRVESYFLPSPFHPRFNRALELLNKTNQFNTTGQRWKMEDCRRFLGDGGMFSAFDVVDRFTSYGLVGVVLLKGDCIVQWAMSCRVIGMRVEQAVMASLIAGLRAGGVGDVKARLQKTQVNQPCHQLFANSGFLAVDDHWFLPANQTPSAPPYVKVETTADL